MNSSNQARLFEAKDSYFEPPKSSCPQTNSSPSNGKHTLEQSIEDFKLRGKSEGRAKKTMEQYEYVLGRLLEKISEDREVRTIEALEVRKYLAYLMKES